MTTPAGTSKLAHYVAHLQFALAIADFLERETAAVDGYVQELQAASPFKSV